MDKQIATTPEQSQRLIACGVNPDTADMVWKEDLTSIHLEVLNHPWIENLRNLHYSPAWSLAALFALLPPTIPTDDKDTKYQLITLYQLEDNKYYVGYVLGRGGKIYGSIGDQSASTLFDAILELTIWYIKRKSSNDRPGTY